MIHSTPDDQIFYQDVHEELLETEPWGEYKDGRFVGCIVISNALSSDLNVPTYEFTVSSLVDDFFDSYASGEGIFRDGVFIYDRFEYKDESLTMARGIVSDLKAMTARLEAAIAKSEEAALQGGDE